MFLFLTASSHPVPPSFFWPTWSFVSNSSGLCLYEVTCAQANAVPYLGSIIVNNLPLPCLGSCFVFICR